MEDRGTKKRKQTFGVVEEEHEMGGSLSPSGPRQHKRVAGITSPGSSRDIVAGEVPGPSAFLAEKESLWQQHNENLNTQLRDRLLEPGVTPDEAYVFCIEHQRLLREVQNLYHRPVGEVIACGSDDVCQLGVRTSADEDGKDQYPPTIVKNLNANIIQVACGGLHSVALDEAGKVWTWGCNDDYALGRGKVEESEVHLIRSIANGFDPIDEGRIVAVAAGDNHSLFLSLEGNVYMSGTYLCWEKKFAYVPPGKELKVGSRNETPVKIKMPQRVRKIAAGYNMDAAILADETLVTWGLGECGELARSRTMGAPRKDNEDGIFNLGKFWVGEEYEKEVADKDGNTKTETEHRFHTNLIAEKFLQPSPALFSTPGRKRVLDVACGDTHILVVAREEGQEATSVFSAGHNRYGKLGHGDENERHELTKIKFFEGREIIQVAAGSFHSLALSTICNAVYSWGRADYGQLGLFDRTTEEGHFEASPKVVPFPRTKNYVRFREISAGGNSSMAIKDDNTVYTWGFNTLMQLGHPNKDVEDVCRPKELDPMRKYKGKKGSNAHTFQGACGAQHSLFVVKRFD